MRVVFAGTPQVAVPSLTALLASSHDVVAVLTRPDAPAGRGRALAPSPVKEHALAAGIEVLTPANLREESIQARLRELAPDACPIVAYGALIPPTALVIPALGWVNLHFSLLPAWRGAAPVQHAIIAGDDLSGASTFLVEEGLDTGPILGTLVERIGPRDTSGELLERLSYAGASLLVASLDALAAGVADPRPQPADGVTKAPKITVDDARVDWSRPAYAVDRLIRGCTPAPGAWTMFRGERLGLEPVEQVAADVVTEPIPAGAPRVGKRDVLVGTGDGVVRLGAVRPPGKREMTAADWARGVRIEPGEGFA